LKIACTNTHDAPYYRCEFLELFSGEFINNHSQVFSRQYVTIEKEVSKNSNSESKVYPTVPTKEANPDDIPF
jgi:hypothetical protein